MSIEAIFKFWPYSKAARVRRIRPVRDWSLQLLESRIALSAGPQLPLAEVPDSPPGYVSSSDAQDLASSGHDATPQSRSLDTDQQLVTDPDATSPGPTPQPTGTQMGVDPDAANPDPQADSTTDQTDSSSDPSQPGSDGGADQSSQDVEPNIPATAGPTLSVAQPSGAGNDFNPGLLDPLAWIDAEDPSSDLDDGDSEIEETNDFTGIPSSSDFTTLQAVADETGLGGAPASLVKGAWRVFSFETFSLSDVGRESLRDPQTPDVHNDLIIADAMPSRTLLSGLDRPDQTASDSVERSAELSPLEHSSPLALVATLSTTPSRNPPYSQPGNQPADPPDRYLDAVTPLSSWSVYVMGLDQAFERSCRDICQGANARASSTPSSESARGESVGGPEWRMPIVPIASAAWFGADPEALPHSRARSVRSILAPEADRVGLSPAAGERESPSGSDRDPQLGSEARQSVPIVTLITGSTLVAGWLWTRRASSPRNHAKDSGSSEH
jgi:hypothetical protein